MSRLWIAAICLLLACHSSKADSVYFGHSCYQYEHPSWSSKLVYELSDDMMYEYRASQRNFLTGRRLSIIDKHVRTDMSGGVGDYLLYFEKMAMAVAHFLERRNIEAQAFKSSALGHLEKAVEAKLPEALIEKASLIADGLFFQKNFETGVSNLLIAHRKGYGQAFEHLERISKYYNRPDLDPTKIPKLVYGICEHENIWAIYEIVGPKPTLAGEIFPLVNRTHFPGGPALRYEDVLAKLDNGETVQLGQDRTYLPLVADILRTNQQEKLSLKSFLEYNRVDRRLSYQTLHCGMFQMAEAFGEPVSGYSEYSRCHGHPSDSFRFQKKLEDAVRDGERQAISELGMSYLYDDDASNDEKATKLLALALDENVFWYANILMQYQAFVEEDIEGCSATVAKINSFLAEQHHHQDWFWKTPRSMMNSVSEEPRLFTSFNGEEIYVFPPIGCFQKEASINGSQFTISGAPDNFFWTFNAAEIGRCAEFVNVKLQLHPNYMKQEIPNRSVTVSRHLGDCP